jgi:hypothetical protein
MLQDAALVSEGALKWSLFSKAHLRQAYIWCKFLVDAGHFARRETMLSMACGRQTILTMLLGQRAYLLTAKERKSQRFNIFLV